MFSKRDPELYPVTTHLLPLDEVNVLLKQEEGFEISERHILAAIQALKHDAREDSIEPSLYRLNREDNQGTEALFLTITLNRTKPEGCVLVSTDEFDVECTHIVWFFNISRLRLEEPDIARYLNNEEHDMYSSSLRWRKLLHDSIATYLPAHYPPSIHPAFWPTTCQ